MGTRFELAMVIDEARHSAAHLRAVGELALREIDDWHQRLTRFEAGSWLSHVNRTAADEPVPLDDELYSLFDDAIAVWRDSGGAFDIARGHGSALALDPGTRALRFLHDRASLDLGAIGKGHALDCAANCLRSHGVTRALIQGGTSSGVALGVPPHGTSWRIGLASTTAQGGIDDVIDLADLSFSVSDDGSQAEAPGGRHIVDHRQTSGERTVQASRRVVVTGPSARLTDAWSTALVVLGEVPAAFPIGYAARFVGKEP
jgi:thiamine biosynthesis lipoprotein